MGFYFSSILYFRYFIYLEPSNGIRAKCCWL